MSTRSAPGASRHHSIVWGEHHECVSDWRRWAREVLRRLVEPECGPGQQLHSTITALPDAHLLHLIGRQRLRDAWVSEWKLDPQALCTVLFQRASSGLKSDEWRLTASTQASMAAWLSCGLPVTKLAIGAPLIADGATMDSAYFFAALRREGE